MTEETQNVVALPRKSVIADMAERFHMEIQAFEQTLRATVMPASVTREQFAAFLMVAREYNLNPLVKEIFAFPGKNGSIIPVVSVDGWMRIINSHPQMNGLKFQDTLDDSGNLSSVTALIFRKDRDHEVEVTEYMVECHRDTDTWRKWPRRMLRHKAAIQAARYAFGFAGIYDLDEAERMKTQAGAGIPAAEFADIEVLPGDDASGQFLGGEIADLLRADYVAKFDSSKTLAELDTFWKSFQRKYYNKTKKRISAEFFGGIEELYERAKERVAEEEFQAHQRETDVTAAASSQKDG